MRDYIILGSTPRNETPRTILDTCGSFGYVHNNHRIARLECLTYIGQLKREYGNPPLGVSFGMKTIEFAGKTTFVVVIWYKESFTDEMTPEMEFTYGCENGCDFWDTKSNEVLKFNNYYN